MPRAKFLDTYDVVEFSVYPDGERVICWISQEALADHFGATRDSAVSVLLAHLERIAPVANRVRHATPAGQHILIRTSDF